MAKFYARVILGCFSLAAFLTASAQVSVTASAGTTGPTTYTTLKGAFDAINAGTHTGAVTVTITASTTEAATAVLNPSGTGSTSYTGVTIKPGAGVSPTVTGDLSSAVVALLGSNVTIDGSNNGTTTRNLTINNTDTANLAAVWIPTGNSATTNVVVKNTILKSAVIGLLVSDAASLTTGGRITSSTFENNLVQNTIIGFYISALPATGNGNVSVIGNDISATGANVNYSTGIYATGLDGATIARNIIGNFNAEEEGDDAGILIGTGSKNTVIDRNRIFNLTNTSGVGYGAYGIAIASGTANANIRISNNMISGISGDGWDYLSTQYALDNPFGILLAGNAQSGINIHYNTIYMSGGTLDQAGALSAGIYLSTGSTAAVTNNIVVNNLGLAGTTGYGAVGIYAATGAAQFTANNYNNIYVAPTGSGTKAVGMFATAPSLTLANWQAATGANANSKNVMPVFVSATDLHLQAGQNTSLDNAGTPVAGITVDFDGETRSTTTPDIGADEFGTTTTPVSAIDFNVAGVQLLPNLVNGTATLRIQSKKTMNIEFQVVDITGRQVMRFSKGLVVGQNTHTLDASALSSGTYQVFGITEKGRTEVIKFVKQ